MEKTERNKEVLRLYLRRKKSMTIEQIGEKFGITKQRVTQIIKNARSKR